MSNGYSQLKTSLTMQDGGVALDDKEYLNSINMLNEAYLLPAKGQTLGSLANMNLLAQQPRDSEVVWNGNQGSEPEGEFEECARKVLKSTRDSDATSSMKITLTAAEQPYDISSAASTTQFALANFTGSIPTNFAFSAHSSSNDLNGGAMATGDIAEETGDNGMQQLKLPQDELRERSLSTSCPAKVQGFELRFLSQPEEQHRARYMTEGSRGAIKDRTQKDHPRVKLLGYNRTEPLQLQVFIGSDSGKVRPHSFYQACRVYGKNSTQCVERQQDGTTVVELELDPKEDMTACIDCVGILKLRNVDVERRVGATRSRKKSNRVRLVCRVLVALEEGSNTLQMLQAVSTPICCSQPSGRPEISRMSLASYAACGGHELFIIGKNFTKGTEVIFQQPGKAECLWSASGDVDEEFLQPTHIICKIPPYCNLSIAASVDVDVVIKCAGRVSDPMPFTYTPCVDPHITMGGRKRMSAEGEHLLIQQQHHLTAGYSHPTASTVKMAVHRVDSHGHMSNCHLSSTASDGTEHGVKRCFSPTGGPVMRTSINDVTPQFVGLNLDAEDSLKKTRMLKQHSGEHEIREVIGMSHSRVVQEEEEPMKRSKYQSDVSSNTPARAAIMTSPSGAEPQMSALLSSLETLKPEHMESLLNLLAIVKQNTASSQAEDRSHGGSGDVVMQHALGKSVPSPSLLQHKPAQQQTLPATQSAAALNGGLPRVGSAAGSLASMYSDSPSAQQQQQKTKQGGSPGMQHGANTGLPHPSSMPAGIANLQQQQAQLQSLRVPTGGSPQQVQVASQNPSSPYQPVPTLHDPRYVTFTLPSSTHNAPQQLPAGMAFPAVVPAGYQVASPTQKSAATSQQQFVATLAPQWAAPANAAPGSVPWIMGRVVPVGGAMEWPTQIQQQIPMAWQGQSNGQPATLPAQFYTGEWRLPISAQPPTGEVKICSPTDVPLSNIHPSIAAELIKHQPKLSSSSSSSSLGAGDAMRVPDCRQELVDLVTQTKVGTNDKQHMIMTKLGSSGNLVGQYTPTVVTVKPDGSRDAGIDDDDNLAMMTGEDVQNCFKTNEPQFCYDDASLVLNSGSYDSYQADVDSGEQANLVDDMMSFLSPSSMNETADSVGADYIGQMQPSASDTANDIFYE